MATEVRITMNDCSALLCAVVRRAQLSSTIKSTSARTGVEKNRESLQCKICAWYPVLTEWDERRLSCLWMWPNFIRQHSLWRPSLSSSSLLLIIKKKQTTMPESEAPHLQRRNKCAFVLHPFSCYFSLRYWNNYLYAAWSLSLEVMAGMTSFHSFLIGSTNTGREYEPRFSCCCSAILGSIYS